MNNPDHISESLEIIFWVKILKFFDADPGWKTFGSVTLVKYVVYFLVSMQHNVKRKKKYERLGNTAPAETEKTGCTPQNRQNANAYFSKFID
jgi:hypothetical protein